MDVMWFKRELRKAGKTAEDVANIVGRDRSVVSHIFAGRRRLDMTWARAFAEAMDKPVTEILEQGGVLDREEVQALHLGLAEGDVAQISGPREDRDTGVMRALGCAKPGVDVWSVNNDACALLGLMIGDRMAVDQHAAATASRGDLVIAQVYDRSGGATTVLRKFDPPILLPASAQADSHSAYIVNSNSVVIRGKVVASWRAAP
jgi:hypothetical protein